MSNSPKLRQCISNSPKVYVQCVSNCPMVGQNISSDSAVSSSPTIGRCCVYRSFGWTMCFQQEWFSINIWITILFGWSVQTNKKCLIICTYTRFIAKNKKDKNKTKMLYKFCKIICTFQIICFRKHATFIGKIGLDQEENLQTVMLPFLLL